jgi:hypothetical protein
MDRDELKMPKEATDQPIAGRPRSEITGRHDDGMGANETIDGLTDTEEMLRQAAEDERSQQDLESMPVFDRGDAPPKI